MHYIDVSKLKYQICIDTLKPKHFNTVSIVVKPKSIYCIDILKLYNKIYKHQNKGVSKQTFWRIMLKWIIDKPKHK